MLLYIVDDFMSVYSTAKQVANPHALIIIYDLITHLLKYKLT